MHPARHSYIQEQFVSLFGDDVAVQSVPASDWYRYVDRFPQGRYGWTFPVGVEMAGPEGNVVELSVCPDIITFHMSSFDTATFKQYLEVLCWLVARYVDVLGLDAIRNYEAPPPEAMAAMLTMMEDELYDLSPDALATYSRVQLAILDS